ncbi:hypothetical protein [Mycoplasmopsis columboralis]|uniref:Lipoprotein n=1 Tax=Mycoplasmopsis columboralis TaxID=171282 RepID=A0A449B7F0_9BACT|nr:hypothetical protein [Mycoplasmopsis columboralis]VEU76514.1 Uncharacterised protein [Mycoplasmopsis columboralis]
MKKKNLFKFLFASVAVTSTSAFVASCLYENHPTVVYAKSYRDNNAFLNKQKVATQYNIPSLVQAENELFKSKILTLNLKNVSLGIENSFSANNNHIRVFLNDTLSVQTKDVNANAEIINGIQNDNAVKLYNQFLSNLKEKIKQYYQSHPDGKTVADLLKIDYNETNPNKIQYSPEEKEIYTLFNNINSFSYLNKSDDNKVLTVEKFQQVVSNYLKGTPLYTKFIESLKYPEDDPKSMLKVVRDDLGDISAITFEYNFRVPFNAIPYDRFMHVANQIKNPLTANEIEDSKNVYLKMFEYMKTQQYKLDDSSNSGMAAGFGPVSVLTSTNPEDNAKSDRYAVFAQPSVLNENTPEAALLREEFLAHPTEFIENHYELLNYASYINAQNTLNGAKVNYENSKTEADKQRNYARYVRLQNSFNERETKLNKFFEVFSEYKQLKENNASEQELAQKMQELQEYKTFFASDLNTVRDNLNYAVRQTKTNLYHLVELYGYFMFIMGSYQVQIIKGTYTYPNASEPRETYWLEFYDKKTNKWYMVDIYKGFLSYQADSSFAYNPEEEIYTSLPSGYTIDQAFNDIAHVK